MPHLPQSKARAAAVNLSSSTTLQASIKQNAATQAMIKARKSVTPASSNTIQRYKTVLNPYDSSLGLLGEVYKFGDFKDGARVFENELVVLESQGSQDLWATKYMIGKANDMLKSTRSSVRLGMGEEKVVPFKIFPDVHLHKVVPKLLSNEPFTLVGDCGKATEALIGSSVKFSGIGKPTMLPFAAEVVNQQQHDSLIKFLKGNSKYLKEINEKRALTSLEALALNEITLYEPNNPNNHRRVYKELSTEARRKFDSEYHYDDFARPSLGQAYIILPDQLTFSSPPKHLCPYHFGTVIMEGGNDQVTLEQYTGRDDTDWYFMMYEKNNPERNFNARWQSSFDSKAMTTTVEPG